MYGGVLGYERGVEEGASALDHVTRHVTVVDDNLNVASTGRRRVHCTKAIIDSRLRNSRRELNGHYRRTYSAWNLGCSAYR